MNNDPKELNCKIAEYCGRRGFDHSLIPVETIELVFLLMETVLIMIRSLSANQNVKFAPVCAISGGLISQEILKAISSDTPIEKNMYVCDAYNMVDCYVKL